MADTKTSDLTALTGAGVASGDKIPIADVSATTLKSITADELRIAMLQLGVMPFFQLPAIGDYFPAQSNNPSQTGSAMILDRCYYVPIFIGQAITVDTVVLRTGGSVGSSTVRCGLYNATSAGKPGTNLADGGTVSTASGGTTVTRTFTAVAVTPGLHYIALASQGVAANMMCSNGGPLFTCCFGSSTVDIAWTPFIWAEAGVSGALPGTATPVATQCNTNMVPICGLKRSA